MPAYKDKAKGTWYASFYYEDWTGKKVKKMKRGFPTKREALEWERTFLQQQTADLEMTFENFVAVYVADMKGRIKENTWGTKEHILYKKLVPYFGKRKMCDIHSKEVIAWQNEMLNYRDKNGKPYSPVYLKTLHNQLSAVFNNAVRHYNLKVNPAAQVGNMGKPKSREMLFWTKAEYLKFAEAMMDKPLSYYAFEMLYWCGVREGELLALKLIIVDTLQKVRETVSDSYSYSSDYEVIGKLKQFADRYGVCVLIVHHTRKQPAGDSFEMISGTTGLLGCADGALLMQKEKRTDSKATLEVVGRDQPDQRLYLSKDQESLVWDLDHAENELWKQPPDPVLEAVAKIVSAENREWEGSPTELAQAIQTDMAVSTRIACG